MRRVRDNERGQVIVLAAVMIPVMLLTTALAVDVGNWYTHKRQLQNRADAGALAGGYQYVADWASCSVAPRRSWLPRTGSTPLRGSTPATRR